MKRKFKWTLWHWLEVLEEDYWHLQMWCSHYEANEDIMRTSWVEYLGYKIALKLNRVESKIIGGIYEIL